MSDGPELFRIGVGGVVPVQWEAEKSSADPGTLTGWASVYNVIDRQDDVVVPGAFRKTLSDWRASKRVIGLTLDHQNDADGVIGALVDAQDSSYGLKTTFRFSSTPKAQEARTKAREGILNGLSFFGPIYNKSFDEVAGKSIQILKEIGLWFVGLTPVPANTGALVLAAKAVSDKPWSQFTEADYTPEQWKRACLIDTGVGDAASKSRYKLPVKEPNGAVNRNGVHAAAARLNQVQAAADKKAAAARAMVRMYGEMNEDPPDSLRRMAGMMASASLPTGWIADMRSALTITSPVAQKAAVDTLVADMYGAAPAIGDGAETPPDDGGTSTDGEDDAAKYALALVGENGPGGSPPDGEPVDPLADFMASLDAGTTSRDLDALAAEITGETS